MKTNPLIQQLQFSFEYLSSVCQSIDCGDHSTYKKSDLIWAFYDYCVARQAYVYGVPAEEKDLSMSCYSLSSIPVRYRVLLREYQANLVTKGGEVAKKLAFARLGSS